MEIIEVKQNLPKNYFRVNYIVGNICNYNCWYCFPGSNEGDIKWPDLDLITKNLSHLLDYYIKNTNKRKFEIALLGGEVTHWKQFLTFIKYFKERYNCVFILTTNGSKKLDWWEEVIPYLDQITISHHQALCDKQHLRNLADLIYKKNVLVNVSVIMDTNCWDDCIQSIEYYKKSKYRWSIRYIEVILTNNVKYTDEQKALISKVRARSSNPFYYLRVNNTFRSSVKVIDTTNKTHNVSDNMILSERLNYFYGWDCSLGIDWVAIDRNGKLVGTCSNNIYDASQIYNIYDANFTETFSPTITSSICTQTKGCWCGDEINMSKKKVSNTRKVIPIHAA